MSKFGCAITLIYLSTLLPPSHGIINWFMQIPSKVAPDYIIKAPQCVTCFRNIGKEYFEQIKQITPDCANGEITKYTQVTRFNYGLNICTYRYPELFDSNYQYLQENGKPVLEAFKICLQKQGLKPEQKKILNDCTQRFIKNRTYCQDENFDKSVLLQAEIDDFQKTYQAIPEKTPDQNAAQPTNKPKPPDEKNSQQPQPRGQPASNDKSAAPLPSNSQNPDESKSSTDPKSQPLGDLSGGPNTEQPTNKDKSPGTPEDKAYSDSQSKPPDEKSTQPQPSSQSGTNDKSLASLSSNGQNPDKSTSSTDPKSQPLGNLTGELTQSPEDQRTNQNKSSGSSTDEKSYGNINQSNSISDTESSNLPDDQTNQMKDKSTVSLSSADGKNPSGATPSDSMQPTSTKNKETVSQATETKNSQTSNSSDRFSQQNSSKYQTSSSSQIPQNENNPSIGDTTSQGIDQSNRMQNNLGADRFGSTGEQFSASQTSSWRNGSSGSTMNESSQGQKTT